MENNNIKTEKELDERNKAIIIDISPQLDLV
jgi:hypothetical protein